MCLMNGQDRYRGFHSLLALHSLPWLWFLPECSNTATTLLPQARRFRALEPTKRLEDRHP